MPQTDIINNNCVNDNDFPRNSLEMYKSKKFFLQ